MCQALWVLRGGDVQEVPSAQFSLLVGLGFPGGVTL